MRQLLRLPAAVRRRGDVAAIMASPLVRSSSAMISSALATSGLGFVYWIVAARLLSVREVGVSVSVITATTLVANIAICGMSQVSTRFLPALGPRRRVFSRQIEAVSLGLGVMGGLAFVTGSGLWAQDIPALGVVFVGATAVTTAFIVQDGVLLGIGQARWIPVMNVAFGVGKLVLLILAVNAFDAVSWRAVVFSWWIATLAGAVLEGWLIDRLAQRHLEASPAPSPPLPSSREIGRFALVNHAGALLIQLPPLIYPVLVLELLGQEPAAFFYISWTISSILLLMASNISTAMVAHASVPGADVGRLLALGQRYALALVVPGVLVLAVGGPYILAIFGAEYRDGYSLLLFLALAALVYPINTSAMAMMRVRLELKPVLLLGGVAGLLTVALTWPLSAAFGLPGFGIAFLAGQTAAALLIGLPYTRRPRPLQPT